MLQLWSPSFSVYLPVLYSTQILQLIGSLDQQISVTRSLAEFCILIPRWSTVQSLTLLVDMQSLVAAPKLGGGRVFSKWPAIDSGRDRSMATTALVRLFLSRYRDCISISLFLCVSETRPMITFPPLST